MNELRGLDAWITGGRYSKTTETVYCHNRDCDEFSEPVVVTYESEYGGGWYTPEECPKCGHEWHDDEPTWPDEDDEPEWYATRRKKGLSD